MEMALTGQLGGHVVAKVLPQENAIRMFLSIVQNRRLVSQLIRNL